MRSITKNGQRGQRMLSGNIIRRAGDGNVRVVWMLHLRLRLDVLLCWSKTPANPNKLENFTSFI
jgi:hypothetical protein